VVKVTAVKQANLLSRAAWQEMQGHNSWLQ
jgi:hypothetical protein